MSAASFFRAPLGDTIDVLLDKHLGQTTGIERGLLGSDPEDKLITIRVGEVRSIAVLLRLMRDERNLVIETLNELASAIEASGEDREDGLHAKHESATPKGGRP